MDENIKNKQNYLANFENKSEGVAEVLVGSPGLLEGQEPKVIGGGEGPSRDLIPLFFRSE